MYSDCYDSYVVMYFNYYMLIKEQDYLMKLTGDYKINFDCQRGMREYWIISNQNAQSRINEVYFLNLW